MSKENAISGGTEVLSLGKTPQKSDDRWIMANNVCAVIDGASAGTPILYDGLSSGEYAAQTVSEALQQTDTVGVELINFVTQHFSRSLSGLAVPVNFEENPR